jgi:hypothetical protein
MMMLLILTVLLAFLFAISLRPRTPRELLRMRQRSGAMSDEAWEYLQQFREQYGTPLTMIAPVLSALEERLGLLNPSFFASRRLAMLEETGEMERELQRQAQALQASGFRGSSLARAMMGARLGALMNRERMMADLALQEQLFAQQLREQVARERFGLLMDLQKGLQEQAVKGGALAMESALRGEQLASQQMAGLMQGIGALAGAYAQYRQQQEMLRTLRAMQQPRTGA